MTDFSNAEISVDLVKELLSEEGFEVVSTDDPQLFEVRDVDSGISIHCALQDNILFNTLPCFTIADEAVTLELARKLLDGNNGIDTSAFELYPASDGKVSVVLENFCKLQALGPEDRDDIVSCLSFLAADVIAARDLLEDYA